MQWGVIVVIVTPDREVVVFRDIGVGQNTAVAVIATAAAAGGGVATPATRAEPMVATETGPGTPTVASMARGLEVGDARDFCAISMLMFIVGN